MTKVTHLTLGDEGELARKRIHLREISGDADTPLETVGQDLRAARLRRGDDLATVSRALKIRKDHLEALEEDRFEALPGRAYAIGFVRSYADFLGLDPLQCVERFKGEIAGRVETQPTVGPPPDTDTMRLPQGWLVIGISVLALVIYGAYHLARSADALLRQPVAQVPARMAPPPGPAGAVRQAVLPLRASASANSTKAGALSASKNAAAPSVAASVGASASAPTPAAPLAAAVPGSANAMGTAAQGAVQAQQAASPSLVASLPKGEVYGAQNRNARVVLRAYAPVRILVQGAGGTVYQNRMLQPGDSYNVPNRVGLTLTTANGSAVGLELDGQPMGYAGRASQMTEALSLDPQAIVDRYNRANPG